MSSLIEREASNEEVAVALAVLEEAYIEATTLNDKYKQAASAACCKGIPTKREEGQDDRQ
jgi:hypothetical protein